MEDSQQTKGSNGQFLFAIGLVTFLVGGIIWLVVGCNRYMRPCIEPNGFYPIGAAITGIGALMFIIGWLLMRRDKANEPSQ